MELLLLMERLSFGIWLKYHQLSGGSYKYIAQVFNFANKWLRVDSVCDIYKEKLMTKIEKKSWMLGQ